MRRINQSEIHNAISIVKELESKNKLRTDYQIARAIRKHLNKLCFPSDVAKYKVDYERDCAILETELIMEQHYGFNKNNYI